MRAAIAALALSATLAACATTRPVDGGATPIGKDLVMHLPASPGWPGHLSAHQTVIGRFGLQKGAFEAALDFTPDKAVVVVTAAGGPRILGVTWTKAGIIEDRTPLAPETIQGLNILGDIFISLWPIEAVRRAMPEGVTVVEEGGARRVRAGDRLVEEVITTTGEDGTKKQTLRNLELGYELNVVTDAG